MLWLSESYLKVWKVESKGKYSVAQCSSGKKQEDGTYINSNWNVKLIGKANDKGIKVGDRIKTTKSAVENIWDADKKRNWLNVLVFNCELQGEREPETGESFYPVSEDDSELPF